jgi:hypothetical protein
LHDGSSFVRRQPIDLVRRERKDLLDHSLNTPLLIHLQTTASRGYHSPVVAVTRQEFEVHLAGVEVQVEVLDSEEMGGSQGQAEAPRSNFVDTG